MHMYTTNPISVLMEGGMYRCTNHLDDRWHFLVSGVCAKVPDK